MPAKPTKQQQPVITYRSASPANVLAMLLMQCYDDYQALLSGEYLNGKEAHEQTTPMAYVKARTYEETKPRPASYVRLGSPCPAFIPESLAPVLGSLLKTLCEESLTLSHEAEQPLLRWVERFQPPKTALESMGTPESTERNDILKGSEQPEEKATQNMLAGLGIEKRVVQTATPASRLQALVLVRGYPKDRRLRYGKGASAKDKPEKGAPLYVLVHSMYYSMVSHRSLTARPEYEALPSAPFNDSASLRETAEALLSKYLVHGTRIPNPADPDREPYWLPMGTTLEYKPNTGNFAGIMETVHSHALILPPTKDSRLPSLKFGTWVSLEQLIASGKSRALFEVLRCYGETLLDRHHVAPLASSLGSLSALQPTSSEDPVNKPGDWAPFAGLSEKEGRDNSLD